MSGFETRFEADFELGVGMRNVMSPWSLIKGGCFTLALLVFLLAVLVSCVQATFAPDPVDTGSTPTMGLMPPDASAAPTVSAKPTDTPTSPSEPSQAPAPKPAPAALNYAVDETATCSAVGCLGVTVTANQTCKTITVWADVYGESDEWIDDVQQDFSGLKKGSTRRYILTSDEYEDWQLELADVACG